MNELMENNSGCMQPGMELGEYTIMSFLGSGALGESYTALGPSRREDVVLRVLSCRTASRKSLHEGLEQSRRGLEQLKNRKVSRWLAAELDEFFLWVAFERSLHPTLRDAVQARLEAGLGPFTEKEVRKAIFQVLVGLHAIHTAGGVHGSIKPSQCTFSEDEKILLLDAGIYPLTGFPGIRREGADFTEEPIELPGFSPSIGSMIETITFSAPEITAKGDYSPRSDLYSTGYLAWHLMSGLERAGAHFFQALPDGVMESWGHWFLRSLAPDPAERFESAEEMLANLPGVQPVAS